MDWFWRTNLGRKRPQALNKVLNIRLKLKREFEQILQFVNQLKSGPRLLVMEKLQLEILHLPWWNQNWVLKWFYLPTEDCKSLHIEKSMKKYLTWFLTSILLFQSTVSWVLATKIDQSEKPPAVKFKNPFRSLLLGNKDLISLTLSQLQNLVRPERNILPKRRSKSWNKIIHKADFSLRLKE